MKLLLSSRRRSRAVLAVAVCLAALTLRGAAHDFWIEPSAFHPKSGGLVGLRLLVGQDMIAPGYDVRAVRSRMGTRRDPG